MEYGRKEMLEERLVHEKKKLEIMEKEIADLQKQQICPRCGKPMNGFPALSRKDNKTEICSQCGQDEAMEAFNNYYGLQ